MTDAAERLEAARAVLAKVEDDLGLRVGGTGLRPGGVLEVPRGCGARLRAAAALTPEGGWAAFLGVRDVGWEAAGVFGLDLDRVLVVADPGPLAPEAAALLIEGVDLLCVGELSLSRIQQRRLAARARSEGTTILVESPWVGLSRRWAGDAPVLARGVS
ncbi:hypothetical protein I6B53_06085 [Schaalia sp. 19OD2882]|uniref:hypothetical protein n=1 Tax=Schaalia sp. 19OD2882 TaxID=2794089 RepID=UPI001C1ED905|nr:hypothetical protein [Schaalia sp. 19OD2882]QWW18737.1 hypothetical protein I6B53_06085 [Schaalia sp. 19OD2882]